MQFTTKTVRLSYANIFAPKEDLSGRMRYSCALLIPKNSADVERIQGALKKLLSDPETVRVLGGTKNLEMPLRDGDEKDNPEYKGHFYLNAKALENNPPKLYTPDMVELVDKDSMYSGCYVQASISFYPYNKSGKRGIGVGLRGLRKIKDGEPLSGAVVSTDEFNDELVKDDLNDIW